MEATEQTVLEAARAHYDVQRFRRLVQLAEDNYVQHRYAFLQIQSRVKAGVGPASISSRPARASRAGRIQPRHRAGQPARRDGALPAHRRRAAAGQAAGPGDAQGRRAASAGDAVTQSLRNSAAISASVEGLRAARQAASGRARPSSRASRRAWPAASGRNVDGIEDQKRNASAHRAELEPLQRRLRQRA